MTLNLIANVTNQLNPQKAYTSYNLIEHAFKFGTFPVTKDVKLICKIIPKRDITETDCILDQSVVQFTNICDLRYIFHNKLFNESVKTCDIRIINTVIDAKSLDVSVIFKDSASVLKYKKVQDLSTVVNEILSFYTVVNSSLVILPEKEIYGGIVYLHIHNAGSKKSACRVTSTTIINIVKLMSCDKFKLMCTESESFKVTGLDSQLNFLNSIHNALVKRKSNNSPKTDAKLGHNILIIGPPGCGKTALVKYFVQLNKCGLVTVEGSSITNSIPGKSENILESLFNEALKKSQEDDNDICVLLLDQVDNLCRSTSSSSHLKRIFNQLLHLLEEVGDHPGLMVIATTNNIHALNPIIRRADRLEIELYIGTPTEKQRQDILQQYCSAIGIKASLCKKIASHTPGYLGSDLAFLVRKVDTIRKKDRKLYEDESKLFQLFENAICKHKPASMRSGLGIVHSGSVQMSQLGGMNSIKTCLKSFVEWPLKHPKCFSRLGLPFPKGILLYGPPGCAKTSLACAIANATNTNFLSISAAELYSSYVGEAEKNVMELFYKARINSPCIVFIDEIDALVGNRNTPSKNVQKSILSTFLTEMDGVGTKSNASTINKFTESGSKTKFNDSVHSFVIIIAATNRPDKLDSALLRPGRFDKLLYVGPPDLNDRLDILKTVINHRKMPLDTNVDLLEIAKSTEYFTGADLTSLMNEAGFIALFENGMEANSIKHENILESLKCVKPSITGEYQFKLD